MSLLDGFFGLGKNINKVGDVETPESIDGVGNLLPELTLEMDDKELIDLKREWIKQWTSYEGRIKQVQDENEKYWMGKQFASDERAVDNLLFEALETFLPIATRAKADPMVESDNTPEGNALADKVRKMIVYTSDRLSHNLKMKSVTRHWALSLLGVLKVGWSMKDDDITEVIVRPQKLILDPKATIDSGIYNGYYIGERLTETASDLIARFPKKKDYITEKVNEKMGTSIDYIMWTTNDYIFWTLDDEVLDKNKNPHWNYEQELPAQQSVDEFGNPITTPEETVPGNNHFKSPQMPYVFLSIFSLGKQPHDETNLIQQNIPLQDLVNKRLEQIDVNADRSNNSIAMSGDAFTEEQAQKFGKTRRKGGIAWVPTGPIDAAVKDLGAPALPTFIYESLIDYRNEIRNIFGTRGSSPQGTIKESTLGGKQIIKGQDADRIGGGISTYLEEFSDRVYNWYVQLMYVYYDELHSAAVLGKEKAQEYITLVNSEFTSKLTVGVKEGSMIPHDPENKRMEAVELYKIGAMDPITLGERLEMPNPREFAKALYLWKADPIALFPDLQQAQQEQMMMQQQEQEQTMMAQKQDQKTGDEDKHERELQKSMFNNLTKQQI